MCPSKTILKYGLRCLATITLVSAMIGQGCPSSTVHYDSEGFPIPPVTQELKVYPMGTNKVTGTVEEGVALAVNVENAMSPCFVYFDFGDNTPQAKEAAIPLLFEQGDQSLAATDHKYAAKGQYEVKITAIDREGRSAMTKIYVTITIEPVDEEDEHYTDEECCALYECVPNAVYTVTTPDGHDVFCDHGECSCANSK